MSTPTFPKPNTSARTPRPPPLTIPVADPSNLPNSSDHENLTGYREPPPTALLTLALERGQEKLWRDLERFYMENQVVIERSASFDVEKAMRHGKTSELSSFFDSSLETLKVISDGLIVLGHVHPAIGAAVVAFYSVISLEISRRDNNKKVILVKVQMQSMILRGLRHTHVEDTAKAAERERMQQIITTIAGEIKECGSDLNYYKDKGFASKLIKAKIYERRFAGHIEIFSQRRSELQSIITAYIAGGIDVANLRIKDMSTKTQQMDEKLDKIAEALFRKLDTSREQEVLKFFKENGGPEECVKTESLLIELLYKAGDPLTAKTTTERKEELAKRSKALQNELAENLDETLKKNLTRFEAMLKVQENNLKHISEEQSRKLDKIMAALQVNKVDIQEPILRQIWERMGLKRNVKAKSFVLGLRDYILSDSLNRNSADTTPRAAADAFILDSQPGSPFPSANFLGVPQSATGPNPDLVRIEPEDAWVLQYIDAAHAQSIVEIMDEDGSGFISVKEVDKFARSRPKHCRLFPWFAYWAAGWQINLTSYKSKIYGLVQAMHETLPELHSANRNYADQYLNHSSLSRVEKILRSTKSVPDDAQKDSKLTELAEQMASIQEERLAINLKEMSYVIHSLQDVTLVTGPGRIEVWVFPLLYLLLKRHLEIIKLSCKRVLDESELEVQMNSITNIISVFDERMNTLEAIFQQNHRDLQRQFENFAYGMFFASFSKRDDNPSENTLLTFKDNRISYTGNSILNPEDLNVPSVDTSLLSCGLGPTFEFQDIDLKPVELPAEHIPHPIEGVWTGQCLRAAHKGLAFQGCFHCIINPILNDELSGRGETFLGTVWITGKINSVPYEPATEVNPQDTSGGLGDIDGNDTDSDEGIAFYSPETTPDWHLNRDDSTSDAEMITLDKAPEIPEPINGGWMLDEDSHKYPCRVNRTPDVSPPGVPVSSCDLPTPQISNQDRTPANDPSKTDIATLPDTPPPDVTIPVLATPSPIAESSADLPLSPVPVDFHIWSSNYATLWCQGTYDPAREVISGNWVVSRFTGTSPPDEHRAKELDRSLPCGRFHMSRTPADLFRFRHLLYEPELEDNENAVNLKGVDPVPSTPELSPGLGPKNIHIPKNLIAWRRWRFACEAERFRATSHLGLSSFFRARIGERRKWLELTIRREWDKHHSWAPGQQLSSEGLAELRSLRLGMHPTNGRLYDTLAQYLYKRMSYDIGAYQCDKCKRRIIFYRHMCITCMNETFSDGINLCIECIDSLVPLPDKDFTHSSSHSLIRSGHLIHECELALMIPQARVRSERIHATVLSLEKAEGGLKGNLELDEDHHTSKISVTEDVSTFRCACCTEVVSFPCWVCVTCALDTFICLECDVDRRPVRKREGVSAAHSFDHPLMRLQFIPEMLTHQANSSNNIFRLQKHLEEMEARVNAALAQQTKLNERVEQRMKALEESFEQRMRSLEGCVGGVQQMLGLLQQLLVTQVGTTGALIPANSPPLSQAPILPSNGNMPSHASGELELAFAGSLDEE